MKKHTFIGVINLYRYLTVWWNMNYLCSKQSSLWNFIKNCSLNNIIKNLEPYGLVHKNGHKTRRFEYKIKY